MSTPVGSYASLDAVAAASAAKDASPGFKVIGPNPKITFATQGVPPPSPLYVTPNDFLEVRIFNLTNAVTTISVYTRVLTPEGEIKQDRLDVPVTNTTATRIASSYQLGEGFLLSVTVDPNQSNVDAGDCFVQVLVLRPPGVLRTLSQQLISDYAQGNHYPTWPGGPMVKSIDAPGSFRTIAIADPPAGNEFTVTCPANTRWNVLSISFSRFASAAGTPRLPFLVFGDNAGHNVLYTGWTTPQPVSSNFFYTLGVGMPFGLLSGGFQLIGPLPDRVLMSAGDQIFSDDTGLTPGDQYSSIALKVEQWVDA